ncbi:hypothetical protein [Chachezhania sediminis]|uniref:hypothetical protein n=1 Tax=Chachezhania sediminis TaxID=2599291 RepID=UPI00131B2E88|nr:hypothetical protein [Chachezhania sediminis]
MQKVTLRIGMLGAVSMAVMSLAACEGGFGRGTPGLSGELRDMKLQCMDGDYAMCSEIGHIMAENRRAEGVWDGNTPWTKTTRNGVGSQILMPGTTASTTVNTGTVSQ